MCARANRRFEGGGEMLSKLDIAGALESLRVGRDRVSHRDELRVGVPRL